MALCFSKSLIECCELIWRGYDHEPTLATCDSCIEATKTAKRLRDDYRNAPEQATHAQYKRQQILQNKFQLNQLAPLKRERISAAEASLSDIAATLPLPEKLHVNSKRDRFKWTSYRKSKVEKRFAQHDRTESSLMFNLILSNCEDLENLEQSLRDVQDVFSDRNRHTHRLATQNTPVRGRRAAHLRCWQWLTRLSVAKLALITSQLKDSKGLYLLARCSLSLPFGLSSVITGRLLFKNYFPCLPQVMVAPQNIIPADADMIIACQVSDTPKMKEILKMRQTHPNDRTPDGLTVFRYAIRSGNPETVRLLLAHGADPNLPFGSLETSPLNIAFHIGNVAIIRLLLNAGADLNYQNTRVWTSLSYLWDRDRPNLTATSEIIELCVPWILDAWSIADPRGWTACHRAGAYGSGEDIHNLHCRGVNMQSYTADHLWGPITCAVWKSNLSAFDAFTDILTPEEVLSVRDDRGWTLLHMAAKNGCRHILKKLLDMGANEDILTIGTSFWVKQNLEFRQLTAAVIANEYGHGVLWAEILNDRRR